MNLGSLDRVMKQVSNMPEVILGFITYKILKGLAYLHKNKIIHRDIKPGNVLLNDKGDVKIADFGMSRQLDNTEEMVESYVGTMLYMTPERLKGDKYTATTDLWSLGISIIECATGVNPYQKCKNIFEVIEELSTKQPPEMPGNYSQKFINLINSMLIQNPKERMGAQELLQTSYMRKFEKKYE